MLTSYQIEDLRRLRDFDIEAAIAEGRIKCGASAYAFAVGSIKTVLQLAQTALDRVIESETTCQLCGEHSDGGAHHACMDAAAIESDMAMTIG